MNMKALTIPEIAQALWEVSSVLILTHRRPDGDTAGSAAALCRGLRSLGKKAFILENPQLTERYRPYHRGLTCPAPIPGALVVSVDVAGREMLCKGDAKALKLIRTADKADRGQAVTVCVVGGLGSLCQLPVVCQA